VGVSGAAKILFFIIVWRVSILGATLLFSGFLASENINYISLAGKLLKKLDFSHKLEYFKLMSVLSIIANFPFNLEFKHCLL